MLLCPIGVILINIMNVVVDYAYRLIQYVSAGVIMHRFINMLIQCFSDVTSNRESNKNGKDNCRTHEGNRESKRRGFCFGYSRGSKEQELYHTRTTCSMPCIRSQRRQKGQIGERKESTASTRRQEKQSSTSIINFLSPLIFSYNFITILQSIDDVCLIINPYLAQLLLGGYIEML